MIAVPAVLVSMMCFAQDDETAARTTAASPAVVSNQFVFTLVDGTKLVCEPQVQSIPLKTSYADVDVPFIKTSQIAFDREKKEITVRFLNGDQLKGNLNVESIKVKSLVGSFSVTLTNIVDISNKVSDKKEEKVYSDSPVKKNRCINNLRMIDSAKEQSALANKWGAGMGCDKAGAKSIVNTYIKGNTTPECTAGGTYKYNPIGENPECSVPGHELPVY